MRVAVVTFEHVQGPHYYGAADPDLPSRTAMVGETRFGQALGRLALPVYEAAGLSEPLVPARAATADDLAHAAANRTDEDKALADCGELVRRHDLPMRLVEAFLSLDRRQLTFFFTAPGRVDFRGLLRDLVQRHSAAIRLEQIGERDTARLLGGIGRCGRTCCCTDWMPRFEPVSMTHAKEQGLPPMPGSLGGLCGKLRCCLRFELDDAAAGRAETACGRQRPTKTAMRHDIYE